MAARLGAGLPGLLVDLRERRIAAGGDLVPPASQLSLLRAERGAAPGDLLCPLHHLEHDLFQVTLPPFQRNDLRLQVLQFLGRGDLAGVQPGPVPLDPGADLVHVAFGLGLVPGQIAVPRLQRGQFVAQFGVPLLCCLELSVLRQGTAAMIEAAELGVQLSQFEEFQLRLRRCFHESTT